MPTIVGYHDIAKGQDHWLRSPKRKELFGPLGATNIRTFVDPQNPKRVAVMMDVPDLDALNAVLQSPAAAEAMAHDGVESLAPLLEASSSEADGLCGLLWRSSRGHERPADVTTHVDSSRKSRRHLAVLRFIDFFDDEVMTAAHIEHEGARPRPSGPCHGAVSRRPPDGLTLGV